jgi:hypothetical protein
MAFKILLVQYITTTVQYSTTTVLFYHSLTYDYSITHPDDVQVRHAGANLSVADLEPASDWLKPRGIPRKQSRHSEIAYSSNNTGLLKPTVFELHLDSSISRIVFDHKLLIVMFDP